MTQSTTDPSTAWFQGSPVVQIDNGRDFSKWFQGSPVLSGPPRLGLQRNFSSPIEFGQLLQRAHGVPVETTQGMARLFDVPVAWALVAVDVWGLAGGGAPVWWYPAIYDTVHEKPAILIWDPAIDRYPRAPRRKRAADARSGGLSQITPQDLARSSLPLQWIKKWQAPGYPIHVRTAAQPPEYWSEEVRTAPFTPATLRPLSYQAVPRTRGGLRTVPLPEVVEARRRRLLDRRNREAVLLLLLEEDG